MIEISPRRSLFKAMTYRGFMFICDMGVDLLVYRIVENSGGNWSF